MSWPFRRGSRRRYILKALQRAMGATGDWDNVVALAERSPELRYYRAAIFARPVLGRVAVIKCAAVIAFVRRCVLGTL